MIKATQCAAVLILAVLFVAGLAWVNGQDRAGQVAQTPPFIQNNKTPQTIQPPPAPPSIEKGKRGDPAHMTLLQRHFYLSAQRGRDWLQRANKPNGRFVYGLLPSLRQTMDSDSYLAQAEAAFTLARAARFFVPVDNLKRSTQGFVDSPPGAIARQALLTLLEDTILDPSDRRIRYTIPASNFLNRPAAAGLLVLAIHELPAPGADLLIKADELCNFLQRQVRTDGSLALQNSEAADNLEDVECFSGPALLGIIRSQQLRPAPWKIEALRRARVFYQSWWQRHKNLPMVPQHTAAFTEAFLLTGDQACADFVFEMNDWLCTLQYQDVNTERELSTGGLMWRGGFMPWGNGKAVPLLPDIRSATAAASLADACRAAQKASDPVRYRRYREALENCLRFLTTLQYTEANTQHFADWYRPFLVGGFFASARDGNLRLDQTAHSVSALVQYLQYVAELP